MEARPRSRWRRLWDWLLAAAILGLLILLAARLDPAEMRNLEGRVIVNDGDSITLGAERIRLLGIDAPEFDQICRSNGADYPCGKRARESLSALIGGRQVLCSGWERDKYGRLLATCTAGGTDLNRGQVEAGWAVAYGDYEAEEEAARRKSVGLWAGSFERPRDWRAMHGGMAESKHATPGGILDWLRRTLRLF
ncbi:MAG: thermonuclease family protein [Pseudomonadota bacterium]|nr:thermonuclease family protein [Pseudomonadota bacterium]MDQ2704208.1 thermonuclease family protein [Pseudomonadota bacterium]